MSLRRIATLAAGALVAAAAVAQQNPTAGGGASGPPPAAVAVRGACTSRGSAGCERCEIKVGREVELPQAGGSLTASCAGMAAGRYDLGVAVPIKLVPPESGAAAGGARPRPTFFQVFATFGAQRRDEHGPAGALLPETPRASWSWWDPAGMTLDRTEAVEIPQRATIDVTFRLNDPQYYVPAQSEGPAHRDGRLFIDPGTVMRLTRTPAQATVRSAEPGDFSDATLARLVPGHTTKAQVRSLLGEPWRDTPHGDDEHPVNDVWDYRGRSGAGIYLVHIEFDRHDVARLIAKIPEKSGVGTADVAQDPPPSGKP